MLRGRRCSITVTLPWQVTLWRIGFGIALAVSGSIPYLLIRRCSIVVNHSGRYIFVSVLGLSIILAAVVAALPDRFLRLYGFMAVVCLLALCVLHVNKSFLYEALLNRDLIMQLDRTLNAMPGDPPLTVLRTVPAGRELRILRRYTSIYDLNAPINLLRAEDSPYAYVHYVGNGPIPRRCSVLGFFYEPCPEDRLELEYRVDPKRDSVDKVSYLDLMGQVFKTFASPPGMGKLSVLSERPRRLGIGDAT
jgi:hypothetical protein